MPKPNARKSTVSVPGALRALAVLAFLAGSFIGYLDAQKAADRRVYLSHEVPVARSLAVLRGTDPRMLDGELTIAASAADPQTAEFREGFLKQSVAIYPLKMAGTDEIHAFAWIDVATPGAARAVEEASAGIWHGLRDASPRLRRVARRKMEAAGLTVARDPLPLALYDASRHDVLTRSQRSPWRPVLYWLAAAAVAGSYVFKLEHARTAAGGRRRAVARDRQATGADGALASEKASHRFGPLTEYEEPTDPEGARAALSRISDWADRQLRRLPRRRG